jgi:hypothetical protein
MPSFLGACLKGVAAHLPPSIVPAADDLARFVASLPVSSADELGLEGRLGARDRPVDVLLRLTAPEDAGPLFASTAPIQRFCRAWRDAPLDVHDIWLEFDRDGTRRSLLPSLFFAPRGGLSAGASSARCPAILEALSALVGERRAHEAAEGLFPCVARLPDGGRVFHLGVMLARPTRALRVCVMDVALADVGDYLQRIDWPGPRDALDRARRTVEPWIERVTLALDVDGRPEPRLGIEAHTALWPELLGALVEEGLCSAAEAEELLAWPGLREDGENFPEPLGRMARFLEGRRKSVLHRRLSHVKLVLDPFRPVEAKVYLSVQHRFY